VSGVRGLGSTTWSPAHQDVYPRSSTSPAEATTPDEAFEIVAAGEGVLLQPAGSCAIHRREDVVHRPVVDLRPADLAVVWRSGDRRPAVQVVTDACFQCAIPPQAACGIMVG
jgi:hypothetical protein